MVLEQVLRCHPAQEKAKESEEDEAATLTWTRSRDAIAGRDG